MRARREALHSAKQRTSLIGDADLQAGIVSAIQRHGRLR